MLRAGLWLMVFLVILGSSLGPSNRVAAQDSSAVLAEAEQLDKRAIEHFRAGRYSEGIPLAERVLAIHEKAFGAVHLEVATSLNNLGALYRMNGRFDEALPLVERALDIREKLLDPEHRDVAAALNNLGALYSTRGEYERAEPLYLRALKIREKVLGAEHPDVATTLSNLADLYRAKGDPLRAEPRLKRALEIREKVFGPEHRDVATALDHLAALHRDKADYQPAERLFNRALEIREKALGSQHPDVATSLGYLADLDSKMGNYARAVSRAESALAIHEKMLDPEHIDIAVSLNDLAKLYEQNEDYGRAEKLYLRALDIWKKAFGPEHQLVGLVLNNLAMLYDDKRDYVRAERLHERALAIKEKLGARHPGVGNALRNLAVHYEAKGDYARAVQFRQRGEDIQEHTLDLILSTGSEGQKQLYLDALKGTTDGTVSLHFRSARGDLQAAQLAFTTILRRKGRALDAMTDQINALRQRSAPKDTELLDQLAAAQSQIAKLRLSDGDPNDTRTPEQRAVNAERLTTASEKLQAEISLRSAEFRVQTQPVTLEAVQQALPADTALVEIFIYFPVNVRASRKMRHLLTPRYVAYVLKPNGAVTFVDLGGAPAIYRAADQFLAAISNPASVNAKETGRALDEMVARPIRKLLGDVRNILISPDGRLNLVPFGALVDEQGKYFVEDYTITYLTSGRDLLRLNVPRQSQQTPTVIANPAFNLPITDTPPDTRPATAGNRAPANRAMHAPAETEGRRSGKMRGTNWSALRGTAEEADGLRALLPGARVLTGKGATEGALKQLVAPRILHLATHGFFLPDQSPDPQTAPSDKATAAGENPLLRSGLILAGANTLQGGGDEDGVLTALEAAGLNLWGTQLVVLSACETGVGEVPSGDGVYGLRRALVLAGAESQVMTLWKVDDTATSEVIIEFYRRLQAGEGRTEALRRVQLEFLTRPGKQHPFFWAGFILNGDWRRLK